MTDSKESPLGSKNRRHFFRHACDASLTGAFEYDRKEKWSRTVRSGYLKSEAIAQNHLRVLNIGKDGIALVSRYPVVKGAVVSLKISTAFDMTIRAEVRAKWSKRLKSPVEAYAVGFKFLKMSRANARNLKELLKVFEKMVAPQEVSPT